MTCTKTILVPTSCVVLDPPTYPQVTWELCEVQKICLNLENAKALALYLDATLRYHEHINQVCPQ